MSRCCSLTAKHWLRLTCRVVQLAGMGICHAACCPVRACCMAGVSHLMQVLLCDACTRVPIGPHGPRPRQSMGLQESGQCSAGTAKPPIVLHAACLNFACGFLQRSSKAGPLRAAHVETHCQKPCLCLPARHGRLNSRIAAHRFQQRVPGTLLLARVTFDPTSAVCQQPCPPQHAGGNGCKALWMWHAACSSVPAAP